MSLVVEIEIVIGPRSSTLLTIGLKIISSKLSSCMKAKLAQLVLAGEENASSSSSWRPYGIRFESHIEYLLSL